MSQPIFTGYMSEGWTIRKVMGRGGGGGAKVKKKFSPGTKPRNTRIPPATQARSNITHIVIVRVNTLLNISAVSEVFFIRTGIDKPKQTLLNLVLKLNLPNDSNSALHQGLHYY